MILNRELPDLQALAHRHKVSRAGFNTFVSRSNHAVTHAMTAAVLVQLGARGLPCRRPEFAALVIADVNVAAANVRRNIVIAVARQPTQARVAIERISTGSVGNN